MDLLKKVFWNSKESATSDTNTSSKSRTFSTFVPPTPKRHEDEYQRRIEKRVMSGKSVDRGIDVHELMTDANANEKPSPYTDSSEEEFCDAKDVVRKEFGDDGYIEGKWRSQRLIELVSCQFAHPLNDKTIYIRKQNPGYLLTIDQDNFLARVSFDKIENLNFAGRGYYLKQGLLGKLEIKKVIEDEALNERDKTFADFKTILIEKSLKTTSNLDCAEDIFQLFYRLDDYERFSCNFTILEDLLRNRNVSHDLSKSVQKLLINEKSLEKRREEFIKLPQFYELDLLAVLKQMCKNAIENHRKVLIKSYLESLADLPDHLSKLNENFLFLISNKDIELFADLVDLMKEKPFLDFVIDTWNAFFKRVEKFDRKMERNFSLKNSAPLTNSIYFYLCKSFRELVLEISNKTEISLNELLKKNKNDIWVLIDTITWPTDSLLNHSLEKQYHFVFLTMKHFEPGYYSNKRKLEYKSKLLNVPENSTVNNENTAALSEERLVWVYFLDNAIQNLVSKKEFGLFQPLIKGFSEFANDTAEDQHESFRMAALNEIKFIAQTSRYLTKGASELGLRKQIETIRKACLEKNGNDYKDLINVFNDFWCNRQTILEEIPKKFPCEDFDENMQKICQTLLDLANIALDKETPSREIIKFFRSFNEFLEDLNNLDFTWYIKKDEVKNYIPAYYSENVLTHLELVNEDKNSYKIISPENFIKMSEKIPQHYIIEIMQDLLNTIVDLLKQNQWSNEDNLNATSELLTAIKKSLLYLKEQPDYVSFDLFKKETTEPFRSVVEKSDSYVDFQKRIAIVGESFWYLRRQDEIDIEKALELFKKENKLENNTTADILKNCYKKYLQKFNFYIKETLELKFEEKVAFIIKEVKSSLAQQESKINDWDLKIKREKLPELLAGLSAVWSIQESKDIECTGKVLKPHCIQILCILRLLSVDEDSEGIAKQLAQVLTGQGKSLILGLLSALLALMGCRVRMVCYSEYLSTRDANDFDSFFQSFGIENKIIYGTFEEMANEIIAPELNGVKQELRELVRERILNRNKEQAGPLGQTNLSGTVLLLDEVDVFFSEDFYGNTLNPAEIISFDALATIQEKIWGLVIKSYGKDSILEEIREFFAEQLKIRDESFLEFNEFLCKSGKYNLLKAEREAIVVKEYTNKTFYEEQLSEMVDCAIKVFSGNNIEHYKINEVGVISSREPDGTYSTRYYGNDSVFNYLRLKETDFDTKFFQNYGYLHIECGSISYAKLPEKYPLILGVSGTLTTLHDHEKKAVKEFYNINKNSIMPSFFGDSHLKFDSIEDFIVRNSEEEWLMTIFRHVNSQINSGRSVIVFFDTEIEIEKFEKQYLGKFDRLRKLTPNTDMLTKERYINEAGITKTVTLATRAMGRGVDYKSSVLVEKNGGVHVIQTFFSIDIKEETQIKGRTARKDCKGSYELILCEEHLTKANLEDELEVNYENLSRLRMQKMQEKGLMDKDRVEKSDNKHKVTMEYLESFFLKKSCTEKLAQA